MWSNRMKGKETRKLEKKLKYCGPNQNKWEAVEDAKRKRDMEKLEI